MGNLNSKTLKLINKIIDFDDINNIKFYEKILLMISKIYPKATLAIFFCEDVRFNLKVSNPKYKPFSIDKEDLYNFFNSDNEYEVVKYQKCDFFKKNTLFIKLSIQDSIFGLLALSADDDINEDIVEAFLTVSKILSYKIKDYELNEVFKMQLRAMQDAIAEKDDAYSVIKKQHKKLQEIDKTKSLFLANISHELRTPLNAIIGFSQALDSQIFGSLNDKQGEYIKDIQISGLHLLGMINEILDLSKLESNAMKFCPVELNPAVVINEVINILEPLYKNKNISVVFKNEFNGNIYADNQKFQQILYNLISNAIKFTPQNGKIEIHQLVKDKKYILKIKDNGIGIDKKYHSKIFKKFVHLNNVYSKNQTSTGLGLTITKELVKLHKGKITLESELNKGSCFTMEFSNIIR